jgi:hypothetical protein
MDNGVRVADTFTAVLLNAVSSNCTATPSAYVVDTPLIVQFAVVVSQVPFTAPDQTVAGGPEPP